MNTKDVHCIIVTTLFLLSHLDIDKLHSSRCSVSELGAAESQRYGYT